MYEQRDKRQINEILTDKLSKLSIQENLSKLCDTNEKYDCPSSGNLIRAPKTSNCDLESIERLQQKQCDLQNQLDQVLQSANQLASKQHQKLKCIIEDYESDMKDEGDDDELLEFQQIENELRITEINRQLSNIQEELRLRLYKRLLSSTNGSPKICASNVANNGNLNRISYESPPPSSSSPEEPTLSTSANDLNQAPSTSSSSSSTASSSSSFRLRGDEAPSMISPSVYNFPSSSLRNSSANSDLERIEEDDEDDQGHYDDSDRLRAIYEQKLSPIIQSSLADKFQIGFDEGDHLGKYSYSGNNCNQKLVNNLRNDSFNLTSKFNIVNEGVSGRTATNRPLTLYLPKPNEEVDLIEHIQAMGHDLSIISDELKIDSAYAQGYLMKSCSDNSKKWLKRYFCLDRNSKVLSYYGNESHLVKINCAPKNQIPFINIKDIYVDHKLSGQNENNRSMKGPNFVFVLVTTERKFQLACSRAEVMRAWIDILFTAAESNDYFQKFDYMDNDIIGCS